MLASNSQKSLSTRTTETVIENKKANDSRKSSSRQLYQATIDNEIKPSVASSVRSTTSRKTTTTLTSPKVVNVADLEKVINNLIDLKLNEKNITHSPALSTTLTKTPINSPLIQEEDRGKCFVETPTSSVNRKSMSNGSKPSRFHSPEASNCIPGTASNKNFEKCYLESNFDAKYNLRNSVSPSIPPVPSVMNLKNNDKYPTNKNESSETTSQSSIKVISKIKHLLNKVNGNSSNNSKPDEGLNSIGTSPDLLCTRNRALANLCIGSSVPHDNSEYDLNRKTQSSPRKQLQIIKEQQQQDDNNSLISDDISVYESKIVPIKSPKYTASPPKRQISLFDEIGKELANIERNSILQNLKANFSSTLKPKQQHQNNEVIYQLDDDNIYFKETTLLTSDDSTINFNNYDEENYYTANSSSVIYSWEEYESDNIEKVRQAVLNKTITIKVDQISNQIKW